MKIPDHENCITTPGFNNLTKENFDERLNQANLANRNEISGFRKRQILIKNKIKCLQNIKNMLRMKKN